MSDTHTSTDGHGESLAHPVPLGILFATFGALMILTIFTVMATWVDLGQFNIWLALLIAVIKASLVALYFMHLRWDSLYNGIILIGALFFVAIFIGVVVLDGHEYKVNYQPPARVGSP